MVAVVVNVAIYVVLIVFVVVRQMGRHALVGRRLVVLPAALAVFGVQQLSSAHAGLDAGAAAFLGVNLVISVALGVWRGTTFHLSVEAGVVMLSGTVTTLLSWLVLIAVRVPFALLSHATKYGQGLIIGELLLALAVTFAAQNAVIWTRSERLVAISPGLR